MTKVLILSPSITIHDAVSNDIWLQFEAIRSFGWSPFIYAEHVSSELANRLITKDNALMIAQDPEAIIIYHQMVYWPSGWAFFEAVRGKLIFRYHNITPAHFFEAYDDSIAVFATREGLLQTRQMVASGKISLYLSASQFNNSDLIDMGADPKKMEVLAPFHPISKQSGKDSVPISPAVRRIFEEKPPSTHLLFVGRFAPNKGHFQCLNVLEACLGLFPDEDFCLHFVGSVASATKGYFSKLLNEIETRGLGSKVLLWDKCAEDELQSLYRLSDVFLLMSEHEGFCVPILEAQLCGLPVIAFDAGAVKETLGPEQLCFSETDPKIFATAIHMIKRDPQMKDYLVNSGYERAKRFRYMQQIEKLRNLLVGGQ